MSPISLDLGICEVVLPDNTVARPCRVFVVDEHSRVVIFQDVGGQARIILDEPVAVLGSPPNPHAPRRQQRWAATVASGALVATALGGCNCGSPLKQLSGRDIPAAVA